MPQWLHAQNWPVKFTWPHTCESWSIWLNMNIRYCCLMWEYCTFRRQEFDQIMYASDKSVASNYDHAWNMNLNEIRMWSVVTKQIWLEYPIHCTMHRGTTFDSEWNYCTHTITTRLHLVEPETMNWECNGPHLCPFSHEIRMFVRWRQFECKFFVWRLLTRIS